MEIRYVYVKKRSQFGKQCIFDDSEPTVEENIFPNSEIMKDYIHMNPVHRHAQVSKQFAVHEAQTESTITKDSGMRHTEGGWPKEINFKDEEAVARYRRRVEKDDNWAPRMRELTAPMERYILQNNAMNIYEQYFDDVPPIELVLPLELRTIRIFRDVETNVRPITHLSWSPDHGKRLAASYCFVQRQNQSLDLNLNSYIWDIENPNRPFISLKAAYPSVTIEFNPRDPSMLISGLMSGQVCNWDIRSSNTPVLVSHPQRSHKNPANCILWINSKTNSEFFSASTEGTINWWDIRMLQRPTESLIMDLEDPLRGDVVKATGVSALQYESTMGTKFMVGLENGMVVNGTRKGKNTAEKIAIRFDCHYGPVVAIDRNPFSMKNFLTVGDWSTRIWAEDTREGNLISTRQHKAILTGGCWSTSRYSVFYVINNEGMMEVFDILVGLKEPMMTTRLCENSLKAVAPHEEGKLVAVASDKGKIYLVESSEALTTNASNDKALMSAYFERCSRFEKAVDNRMKESRLAQRTIYDDSESAIPLPKIKVQNKVSPRKLSDKEKKLVDEKKKAVDNRKKSRSKKTKNIWELLGDPELADVERQYFEIIGKEMEKYADAVSDLSDDVVSTSSVREATASRHGKHDDSRDKEALVGGKGDGRKQRTSRGRSVKDKSGKVTKATEEIVIVKRKADSAATKRDEDGQITGTGLVNTIVTGTVDETGRTEIIGDEAVESEKLRKAGKIVHDVDDDDEMEKTIEMEKSKKIRKKKSRVARKIFSRPSKPCIEKEKPCEDEVCDPKICCRDLTGSIADSEDETDIDSIPCQVEDRKMNALIEEMVAGLPKTVLPSQLENLRHYTKEEKRLILKKNYELPSIMTRALKQVKNVMPNESTKVIDSRKKLVSSKRFKVVGEVVNKDMNKSNLNIESLSVVSPSDEIEFIGESSRELRKEFVVSKKSNKKYKSSTTSCEPIVAHFGSKEILRVIGMDVVLPKEPKKINELADIEERQRRKKYPRISAVNIGNKNQDL